MRQYIQDRFLTKQPHILVQETAFNLKYKYPSFLALLLIYPNKQSEKVLLIHRNKQKKTQNTPLYNSLKTHFIDAKMKKKEQLKARQNV